MADEYEQQYTIVVKVRARDQRMAFARVERAIEEYVMRHTPPLPDGAFHVSTPDGTQSTVF